MPPDDPEPHEYASPPCLMHEVDPAYFGLAPPAPDPPPPDVRSWRKAERERLITERLALDAGARAGHAQRMIERLDALVGDPAGRVVSAYWPFRGKPDLRPWFAALRRRGARTALPVVVARQAPLTFRLWHEETRLGRGVWGIPVPLDGEEIRPDVVIAPVVGFDEGCYRLGYGGGFFDRTLAALPATTFAIGVGYAQAAIATIRPQPFDVPMGAIVTEAATSPRQAAPR